MDRLVRVVGLSRSGNHAVIDWVLRQLSGRWCFLNCVEPRADPVVTARPLHDGRRAIAAGVDLEAGPDGRRPTDWILFSQEDTFLGPALGPEATRIQEQALGRPRESLDVLILRDPFNLMASRRKMGCSAVNERTAMRIWKQHARAALTGRGPGHGPPLAISYGGWVRDPGYRRTISGRLGIPHSEEGLERVAGCGGGSSFDGMAYDGRAREMAVFDRWRHFAEDRSFRALFDAETLDLCERLHPDATVRAPLAWARNWT